MSANTEETEFIMPPEKLVGKPIRAVTQRLEETNKEFRVVNQNGLITADYHPQRYTLVSDPHGVIVDAYFG